MKRFISRRELFGGLAASTALIPLLNAEKAWAAAFPRRVVLVMFTNGVVRPSFWPTGGNGKDLSTMTLPTITKSLEPYKSDLVFFRGVRPQNYRDTRGIRFQCAHYAYAVLFTGTIAKVLDPEYQLKVTATSASIDQVIAKSIAATTKLHIPSLHLGVKRTSADLQDTCVFRAAETPIIPEIDPKKVYSKLFAGISNDGSALARLKAERKSVLDFLGKDLTRFSNRLGKDDRLKVEGHLESIRSMEVQNDALQLPTCQGPTSPSENPTLMENYPQMVAAQMDAITAAFKCDLTRVATLQLSNYNGDRLTAFPWLNLKRNSHSIAHDANKTDKTKVDTWFTEQFASFIKRLKDTPEGSGTMLDNTAMFFVNHMGDGRGHDTVDLPFIMAGKCGGAFKTGQVIAPPTEKDYFPTNGIWVALARAMGLTMDVFGDPKYGKGPIPGLMA